jgi:LDH2 family malate/lactate/ureidoglycolate dehydrogenase
MQTTKQMTEERFSAERLHRFTERILRDAGIPELDAVVAADVLLASDLRGIESHGIARLFHYADMLHRGRLNPRPDIRTVHETPSTATVDGDNGLGLVVGPRVYEMAMNKAEHAGSGWIAVRRSNHFGIAGYYVIQALKRDMIGWAMTNASPWVAPLWGAERRLGTNPIAIAFPGLKQPPVVIDMATSVVAYGKIEIARRNGESIPPDWAVNGQGEPTTDPNEVPDGGALAPLGTDRERGGHKGYCLAAMVDLLTGVLPNANWGPFVPSFWPRPGETNQQGGQGIGHFFGAMRIDGFGSVDEFKLRVDEWIGSMRETKPATGTDGPLIPGDCERENERDRSANGIPLSAAVVRTLEELSGKTGVPL